MKVYIIGTGMDQAETLTLRALKLIRGARLLAGAVRMMEPFGGLSAESLVSYDFKEISGLIREKSAVYGKDDYAAVLVSGAPGFYSGAGILKKLLSDDPSLSVEMVPGISSLSYFCAALGMDAVDIKTVSLHGRNANIAVNVKTHRRTFFLLGGKTAASDICRCLCAYGMPDVRISIGENLGIPGERITTGTAEELYGIDTGKLTVLLAENNNTAGYMPSGIDDDLFIRGSRPMTKKDIRVLAVSALNIRAGDVCWDVGSGTGSVSVEMAYRCTDGRVYAFDKSDEALKLTRANAEKFGCDNIYFIKGVFPAEGEAYDPPDRVFIGGSEGKLEDIIRLALSLNPHVKIVVTAVTFDTLFEAKRLFHALFGGCSIRQVSAAYAVHMGNTDILKAQNPVFIIENNTGDPGL